jgi:hypothetical protein
MCAVGHIPHSRTRINITLFFRQERAMTKLDATVRPRRLLHWAAIAGCAAAAVTIGLLTDEAFLYAAAEPEAAAHVTLSETVTTPEPTYREIVPSPVIDTNAQFFFGTGDGSNGYYAERPNQAEKTDKVADR